MLADFEPERRTPPVKLSDIEVQLLNRLGAYPNGLDVSEVTQETGFGVERTRFHLERLRNADLIEERRTRNRTLYRLTQNGRTELFERGMLR
jgi:DNA-binding transcriptional regulator PaaX